MVASPGVAVTTDRRGRPLIGVKPQGPPQSYPGELDQAFRTTDERPIAETCGRTAIMPGTVKSSVLKGVGVV